MGKHTIRDILPPDNRPPKRRPISTDSAAPERPSIQDMGPGPTERPVGDSPADAIKRSVAPERPKPNFPKMPPRPGGRGDKMKYAYYGGGVVLGVVVLSFLFSLFFGGAEVTVHPKSESLTVAGTFSAVSENAVSGELQFEIMTLEKLSSATVPATGSEEAEVKASGQIIIHNEFNESPQRLIRNTRFETPDGLIYRIDKSVVVPGQNSDGSAGTIEVTVYADEPGERYNIGITDFTIPGFKGSPQFEGFFARSKSSMTGGFQGTRLKVEESVMDIEREKLRTTLETELRGQVDSERPDGFMSFSNGVFVAFTSEPPVEKGEEVEITEKAVLYNVLFKDGDLAGYLAANTLGNFDGGSVDFLGDPDLSLTAFAGEGEESPMPWQSGQFEFSMSGNANIVWQFDENALKNDLSGRNKEAITTILSGYSSIDEAEVVIRPFWKGSFPDNVEEITVETILPE